MNSFRVVMATVFIVSLCTTSVLAQDGMINACARKNNGVMRMVADISQCLPTETPLQWNIQGPPGEAGLPGPEGPPGPPADEIIKITLHMRADATSPTKYAHLVVPLQCDGKEIVVEHISYIAIDHELAWPWNGVRLEAKTGNDIVAAMELPPSPVGGQGVGGWVTMANHAVSWRLPPGTEKVESWLVNRGSNDFIYMFDFSGYCYDPPSP